MKITSHARSNIEGRLSSLVSVREVREVTENIKLQPGETWVKVKDLGERVILRDTSTNGSQVNGQIVWAVCKVAPGYTPAVVTVLLAGLNKHRNPNKFYIE